MKKLLAILALGLLVSWNANSDDKPLSEKTINDLLNDGHIIINEDIVKSKNTKSFIKVFTLKALSSSLIICTVGFDSDGMLDEKTACYKP